MTTENRFNLIDEPWIPIVDVGRVSLRNIFSHSDYRALGGNPVQKIALTKLLLAIAQAASTPTDDEDWAELGAEGMAKKCLAYLDRWHDRFWLYGERPFLQMPAVLNLIDTRTKIKKAAAKNNSKIQEAEAEALPKSFGTGFYPDLPSENNTILSECQFDRILSDAEKAIFIVSLMNLALGGKRVEKGLTNFSGQIYGSLYSAKAGPSIGNHVGYLHSFLMGTNLQATLWMNLLTKEKIESLRYWTSGLGVPPWEIMPTTEICNDASNLKNSYLGCLVAMSRFVYLVGEGIYYLAGIQYPSHVEGWREPSISVNDSEAKPKLLWVDPHKRPWRELTSLLSFFNAKSQSGFDCQQIRFGLHRATGNNQNIGIWSGGLKVRANSGDQSVKQDDDFVESQVYLPKQELGARWFMQLQTEMNELDWVADKLSKSTYFYHRREIQDSKERDKRADTISKQAVDLFWQLCERRFQDLVNVCDDFNQANALRKNFAGFANQAYDRFCAKDTARQLDAWAKNRPNLGKYLKDQTKTEEVPA